jgi:hypothetical protein
MRRLGIFWHGSIHYSERNGPMQRRWLLLAELDAGPVKGFCMACASQLWQAALTSSAAVIETTLARTHRPVGALALEAPP